MSAEQGGVPSSAVGGDQLIPRIVNDWEGLAKRMGVADVSGLSSGEISRGLEIYGLDVSTVVWESAETETV